VVIAKGRDVAFASPSLGGSVLPQGLLGVWCQETKTLQDWNECFQAAMQHNESFVSAEDFEATLVQKQLADTFKTPRKKKGQALAFSLSALDTSTVYDQAVESAKKDPFTRAHPAGEIGEVLLGVDSALHNLSVSFLRHVKETQNALESLVLPDTMLDAQQQSATGLLGALAHLGTSPFQSPTVFGSLAAIASKVEAMASAAPALVDFSPIEA
jgi:hypothetical protein